MKELELAIDLKKHGDLKQASDILNNLVKKYPNNSIINYHCACTFDSMGLENQAVPYYEKAIEIGLPDEELQGAFLGLGSTYRTLGEYEKSKKVFEYGLIRFQDNYAIKTFYAMTLYNLGEHLKAMEILLTSLAETTSDETVKRYKRAISFYADKLEQVW